MSVWKSPVFYFGVLLLLLIGGLLAAPYVLDWNSYKSDLEAYGKRLTGRTVQINGDVEIRLFPMPRLTAESVAIGNPEGMDGAPLIHADVLTLSLQLGSLLNGELNVESVEMLGPQITLIRDDAGQVNWMLQSDENLRRSTLLRNVRLDNIALLNGAIRVDDRKRGFTTDISTIDADMSAADIEGPWKLKGSGIWQDLPMAFNFSSSAYQDGEPFRFGLQVTPGDTVLPHFVINGGWKDDGFEGDVSVLPQASDGQKGSVEGGLRPLAFKANLKATASRADLSDIHIAPADTQDSGTLIEGTAGLNLEEALTGEINLKSPRVNLDTLLGAESLATWRAGGLLALSHAFLKLLPEKLNADFALDVTVLTAGGETMNDARIAANISAQGIVIENARAGLPGRSAVRLTEGLITRKDGAAEILGKLAFESNDLRAFSGWAAPHQKSGISSWWKGSRGRLKLQSEVSWSASQFAVRKAEFELEGLPGKGEITLRQGAVPSLDVRLQAKEIDLDSYLVSGTAGVTATRAFDVLGFLDPVLRGAESFEKHMTLDAATVTLNGVRAQDVALDVATSQSGFEIKAFDIGSVGGARVKAEGLILSGPEGPSGDIKASVIANDPSGFLRLVGLAESKARWISRLGQTDIAFTFNAKPNPNGPVLTYTLDGSAQPFKMAFTGGITELERGDDARVTLDGTVTAQDAAPLLSLFGLVPKVEGAGAGQLGLNFSGSRTGGFASKVELSAYGTRASFNGSLKAGEAFAAMSGAVSVFAQDIATAFRALGAPIADGVGGPLRLAFKVTPEDGGIKLADFVGDHAGLALAGEAIVGKDGKLAADFSIGDISLTRILSLALAPWQGGVDLARSFAGPNDLLIDGEIWLRPRSLGLPWSEAVKEAAVGIALGPVRRVQVLAPTMPNLGFSLVVSAKDSGFEAKAEGKMPVDLGRVLVGPDGTSLGSGMVTVSGEAQGEGRSPAAALAALEGKGAFTLKNLVLSKISPEEFAARVPNAKTAGELGEALKRLEEPPGLRVESYGGTFAVNKGLLTASPVRVSGIGTLSVIAASADFTARAIEIKTAVTLTDKPDLPEVTVIYSGVPGELDRRAGTSALASKLGHELLARDLAELERLKTEQEKLALAEEEQSKQDQAKFEAYQAQRAEIRQRQRELKVHAIEREKKRALEAEEFAAFVPEGDLLNRADIVRTRLASTIKPRLATWAEENARLKREEEERQRALAEKLQREEEARLRKIEEEKARAEALRLKAIADEQARIEAARLKAEEDARKAEEARRKAEADAKALADEQLRLEAERQARLQEERLKAEAAARAADLARIEEERKRRLEEDARRKLEELPKLNMLPEQRPAPVPLPPPDAACTNPLYC
jgi:AsmA family